MKKIGLAFLTCLLLAGCNIATKNETGNYKEGSYTGSIVDEYDGQTNTVIAVIDVDKNGVITNVYVDSTYTTSDGVVTTKKALGDNYNMKKYNSSAAGEWYQQANALEKSVVDNQGLDKVTLDSDGYTDTVSGCTIKINALYSALENALNQAKK